MSYARALDVLVVSDDPWWGRVASVVLARAGHVPRVTADSTGRLPRLISSTNPDVVLVLAEGTEGEATAELIDAEAHSVPLVVAVTDPNAWLDASGNRISRAPLVRAWADPAVLVEAVELAARAAVTPLRLVSDRRNAG